MRRWYTVENLTLLALLLAVACGLLCPQVALKTEFLGQLFLRLLKMVIAPLILTSVYTSVAGLGSLRRLKEVGGKTLIYYLFTTALAVLTGLLAVHIWQPGLNAALQEVSPPVLKPFHPLEFLLGLVPINPVKSLAEGKVLQIITFALLLGTATLALPKDPRQRLFDLFEALNQALIVLVRGIIWLTPLGVFGIVSSLVAQKGLSPLLALGRYVITVIFGLGFHALITLGVILWLIGKERPWHYFLKVREALLVAFSTASSSATLPVSLEVATEKAQIPQKVAGFVLPLGSTINMDGTALYEAVAAMFIANIYHVHLNLSDQIVVFLTATLASIGAAGIPSAGLVTMAMVLQAVGLPLEGMGLILAVDRFLDMLRTMINVWGDLIGARIISRLS